MVFEYDAETRLLNRSYWTETGLHQEVYNKLTKLVPDAGESDDRWIELLRCVGNVYHECYSHGGCNLEVKSDDLDTILNSKEVRERVCSDQWQAFHDTVVAHRDQLAEPEGYDNYHTCDECDGIGYESDEDRDGKVECVYCDGSGKLSRWDDGVQLFLHETCGQSQWMGPLEAVTDAVIEVCAIKLLRS